MNFENCKQAVELVMLSGHVPVLKGERGIGKSSLAKQVAKELDMSYVNIDANLLKEGEIGGIPVTLDGEIEGNKIKKTSYAPYSKLISCSELSKKSEVLLFIDEVNRAENAVIQELMNLILNREINGYVLPDNCYLMAAMNPSGSNDTGDVNYAVTEMDAASVDRFVWIDMDSDLKEWIDWASSAKELQIKDEQIKVDRTDSEQNVHPEVIEFLSREEYSSFLNVRPTEEEKITPSPRSWKAFSDILTVYEKNQEIFDPNILYNISKGCLGVHVSNEFLKFYKSKSKPLIKPEAFFKLTDKNLKEEVKKEAEISSLRLLVLSNNLNGYLVKKEKLTKKELDSEVLFLSLLSKDLMVAVMKSLKHKYEKVYNSLSNREDFLDLFVDTFKSIK